MIDAKGIHHIGIAVHSIDEQRPFYENTLGARFEGTEEVPGQQVRVAFFALGPPGAEVRLELLEPMSDESPIAKHLAKRGPGLHHVAYAVSDLSARLQALKSNGIPLIDEKPRRGAHGNAIAFLHPKGTHSVLTELVEPGVY
ncbi:MAG: methylmalonyl-CoA epimerase [Planctomycetota bacterium]